jgi:hypothetical protein
MRNKFFPRDEKKLEYIMQIYSMDMKVKALWIQKSFDEYSKMLNGGEFNILDAFRKATEIISHAMGIVRMIEEAGFVKDPEERAKMRERIWIIHERWELPKPPNKLRKIRNNLEHFEQKMDEWVTGSNTLNVVDFNYGDLGLEVGPLDSFRNINHFDFFFRKQSVNLKEIYEWSKDISLSLEK